MIRLGKSLFCLCIQCRLKLFVRPYRRHTHTLVNNSMIMQCPENTFSIADYTEQTSIRNSHNLKLRSSNLASTSMWAKNLEYRLLRYVVHAGASIFRLMLSLINCFSDACGTSTRPVTYTRGLSVYLSAIMLIWLPIHTVWFTDCGLSFFSKIHSEKRSKWEFLTKSYEHCPLQNVTT